jgi:pimeloyl-ACP methyl ester carboxylesterase
LSADIAETEILGQRLRFRQLEARTPDGLRVAAQDWALSRLARHRGRDVLLIHGISQAHQCWFKQFAGPLSQRYRLVTYDLRGHGDSDKPVAERYYKESAAWAGEVQAVIETAGLVRPVIVAWSYGGRVALDFLQAIGHATISGLVLVAATSCIEGAVFGSGASILKRMSAVTDSSSDLEVTSEFLRACFSQPVSPEEHAFMLSYNLRVPPAIRAAMGGRPAAYDTVLRSLQVPVLALHGSTDCFILPAMAEYTARTCPNGRALLYEGIGHAPFWEAPQRFNADLAIYLDSLT